MEKNNVLLEFDKVTKEFPGVKALDSISFSVKAGTVHALMGENGAGKSTLMKCLFGIYHRDAGDIRLNGESLHFNSSRQALDHGLSMIHQELHPIAYRSVMENIWLGRFPSRLGFVDHKKMYEDTKALFDSLGISIDPREIVKNLTVSSIQLIEIAKAVSYHAKIIIMDEPTSSLTEKEVGLLFDIIRTLRKRGVSIIYISHKMEEILTISDEVTIMRDGKYVGTWESKGLTTDFIISKMVGRELSHRFPPKGNKPGEVIMEVHNLTSILEHSFQDVSFDLRAGEVLGVGGLVGAQRTEILEAIFGLRGVASGSITLRGKSYFPKSPIYAKKNKIALLTEERRATGIVPVLSVAENTVMANRPEFSFGNVFVNNQKVKQVVADNIKSLRIKTPNQSTKISNLSGGNQQKVLIARWLLTEPDILILDEPTRGIDVGAKYEIYVLINELTKAGKSIIMITSEMPELIGMSDRILVMSAGRVAGILEPDEFDQEKVMELATKFIK